MSSSRRTASRCSSRSASTRKSRATKSPTYGANRTSRSEIDCRLHAFAQRGSIVLELAVKAGVALGKRTDELGVQALESLGPMEVLVPETGNAEGQLCFSGH